MTKVYLYCDESGAKGYADLSESREGEVGVFAGILVPDTRLQEVSAAFDAIAAKYTPVTGKLHIADLPAQHQSALRDELFAQVKANGLPCFWYAIHAEGLHYAHLAELAQQAASKESYRQAQDGREPRVKTGSTREEPASMHVELFSGLYANVVAFLSERQQLNVDVEVRTDHVDTPIVKKFRSMATELLDVEPHVERIKGFDTIAQQVVESDIEIRVEIPSELDFNPVIRSLAIHAVTGTDGLVLAADVLSNSLNYLFLHRAPDERYQPLNRPEALANHPLAQHLDSFWDWSGSDFMGDIRYRHPLAK